MLPVVSDTIPFASEHFYWCGSLDFSSTRRD